MEGNMFTKTHSVEQSLLREILSGVYPPGTKIPSQTLLMRKYNVSRTTLLRALRQLTAEGYLHGRRGSGTFVNTGGKKKRNYPVTVVGMHGENYPFGEIFSELGQVNWQSEAEIASHLDDFAHPHSAVIWLLPAPSSILMIEYLHRRGVRQLLINRDYGDFDCICSDTGTALRAGIGNLCSKNSRAPALIAHRQDNRRPYLSEYIISYYEACASLGLLLSPELNCCMDFSPAMTEFREIGKRLFDRPDPVRKIVVLNFELVLPTLMSALSYNLQCGRDFRILTLEVSPGWGDVSGIQSICHDYRMYRREVNLWLKSLENRKIKHFRHFIPRLLIDEPHYTDFSGHIPDE